jgi:hypothetical protein
MPTSSNKKPRVPVKVAERARAVAAAPAKPKPVALKSVKAKVVAALKRLHPMD